MFYPPEGVCDSSSQEIHLTVFLFIAVWNGTGGFKNTSNGRSFWKVKNVLSSGGSLRYQLTSVRLTVFSLHWCRVRYWGFQKYWRFKSFCKLENFLFPRGSCGSRTQGSPFDSHAIYWCRERYWDLKKHKLLQAFLKSWKGLITRMELRK